MIENELPNPDDYRPGRSRSVDASVDKSGLPNPDDYRPTQYAPPAPPPPPSRLSRITSGLSDVLSKPGIDAEPGGNAGLAPDTPNLGSVAQSSYAGAAAATRQAPEFVSSGLTIPEAEYARSTAAFYDPRRTDLATGVGGALADIKANEAARAARLWPNPSLDQAATPAMLAGQPKGLTQREIVEGSIAPDRLKQMQATENYGDTTRSPEMQPPGLMQGKVLGFNEAVGTKGPLRGAASGISSLGQWGIGAVKLASDLVGADSVSEFASGASGHARVATEGTMQGLQGIDKVAANVTSSIINSAPSMILGAIGGPGLKTLFVQSMLSAYPEGRDAGFGIEESLARSVIYGIAEAGGERLGWPEQMELFRGLTKNMPTGEMAQLVGGLIKKEWPGEQATSFAEFVADKYGPAALNPNATMGDYLQVVADTFVTTAGQTLVMGGGPVAINAARQTYQKADRTTLTPESVLARELNRNQNLWANYFSGRDPVTGTKPGESTQPMKPRSPSESRADAIKRFDELAAAHGLKSDAVAAVRKQAGEMPADEVPPFLAKVTGALDKRGLFAKPVDDVSVEVLDKTLNHQPEVAPVAPVAAPEDFTGLDTKIEVPPVRGVDAQGNPVEVTAQGTTAWTPEGPKTVPTQGVGNAATQVNEQTSLQQERQDGNATRETAEASGGDRVLGAGTGGEAQGAESQAQVGSAAAPAAAQEASVSAQPAQPEAAAPSNHEVGDLAIKEVPLKYIKLSKDLPQFKLGANEKGVVEPLGGTFDRTGVGPIQLWQRLNGRLEVITGRHRLDLAERSGEKTIPAQIHKESDGFGLKQASMLDAELNIRDGAGNVHDYVDYFKGSGITKAEAEQRGLLARATGKRAYALATGGSDELIAAHRAGQLSDEAAVAIAEAAPGDSRLQAVGIKAVQDGRTIAQAANTVRAVKLMAGERADTSGDMFGFDDSAMKEAEQMAKIATAKQRELSQRLTAITGAAKNPALAKAEGIDVKNPAAILKRAEQLKQERAAWDNWSTNPDLVEQIRAELHPEDAPVASRVKRDAQTSDMFGEATKPADFALESQTPETLKAKAAQEAAAASGDKAEQKRLAEKAQADAQVGEFNLSGSDRAADVGAAAGQTDIFSIPAETAKPSSVKTKPNSVFTEDAANAARALLKKKLGQLNSGMDPEVMQAGITLAGYHIEKGARTFAAYAKAMIADMGELVRPYLKSWYMAVKYDPKSAAFADAMDGEAGISVEPSALSGTVPSRMTNELTSKEQAERASASREAGDLRKRVSVLESLLECLAG